MSKSYGLMVGFDYAITWVERMDVPKTEEAMKDRVLSRMRYERDQNIPVPVIRHKGKYIHDYYTCGNCGGRNP